MLRSDAVTLPFTSVVGYHMNPMTCGVAKFNAELATRLGVPCLGLKQKTITASPLFSLKASEMDPDAAWCVQAMCAALDDRGASYGFFWHDAGNGLSRKAAVVFYADPSLGSPGLWCPSLIAPRKKPVRLFSFGMAHKLQTDKYRRVRELLDAAGLPFHLRVSVGIHEGTSLSDATQHFDALKEIMGAENVTILGILSDDAVSEELHAADYVLAFFDRGVRANNTTVHAAHLHGRRVISNFDDSSPRPLCAHLVNIDSLYSWPCGEHPQYLYSWARLISEMATICEASKSAIAR